MRLKLYLVENIEEEYPASFVQQGIKVAFKQEGDQLVSTPRTIHAYTDLALLERDLKNVPFRYHIHFVEIELTNEAQREITANIEAHQKRTALHPLTCRNDSNHLLRSRIMNGRIELICPQCGYTQNWIPSYFTRVEKDPDEDSGEDFDGEPTHCSGCGQYPEDCECDSET